MPTDAEIAAPSPSPTTKKSPGRPRTTATETPQQRIERLQAELHHAHEALKLAEQHRATIVGAAVVRHARTNEDFRRQLSVILRGEIKTKADLAVVAELLIEPPRASSAASPS
ncbi:MAG: hypothetical protein ABSC06_30605 [Rhodopila sp.]